MSRSPVWIKAGLLLFYDLLDRLEDNRRYGDPAGFPMIFPMCGAAPTSDPAGQNGGSGRHTGGSIPQHGLCPRLWKREGRESHVRAAARLVAVRFHAAGAVRRAAHYASVLPAGHPGGKQRHGLLFRRPGPLRPGGVGIGVILGLSDYSAVMVVFAVIFALAMNRIRHSVSPPPIPLSVFFLPAVWLWGW